MAEYEIRAAVPDDDGWPTMKRYDPESDTWSVIHEVPQLLSHPDGGDPYVQYLGLDATPPRVSWWRRILYRIALGGRR